MKNSVNDLVDALQRAETAQSQNDKKGKEKATKAKEKALKAMGKILEKGAIAKAIKAAKLKDAADKRPATRPPPRCPGCGATTPCPLHRPKRKPRKVATAG